MALHAERKAVLSACCSAPTAKSTCPRVRAAHTRVNACLQRNSLSRRSTALAQVFQSPPAVTRHAGGVHAPNHRSSRSATCQAAAAASETSQDNRIPVTVITGFLGSGKTTLLNHLLTHNHGRRIAVIENEFGEVDIDSDLVAKQELLEGTADSITRLNNGCLCCVLREDLVKVLNKLWRRRSEFDHIVIETTGLANPAPIINSFFMNQDLLDNMRLDGVVTMVDAFNVTRHLDEQKPADVVNEAVEQVAYADRIIVNKTDLMDEDALRVLEARIRDINEMATMQRAQRGVVPVDYVLGVGGFDLSRIDEQVAPPAPHSHDHDHDHSCSDPSCTHDSHSHAHSHDHDHDHNCAGADCTHESHSHDHAHSHTHENGHSHSHAHSHDHSHDHDHNCSGADCSHESHKHATVQQMKHDDKVSSVSLTLEGEFDLDKVNFCLGTLLSERSEDLFRMKGILAIHGLEERFVYHSVHQLFEGAPDRKWRPDEPRINKMVFIGRYLNKEDFEFAFTQCLVKTGPLEVEVLS